MVGYGSGSGSADQKNIWGICPRSDSAALLPSRTPRERALVAIDLKDLKRRCTAHDRWMVVNPEAVAFSEVWADRNYDDLARTAADAPR